MKNKLVFASYGLLLLCTSCFTTTPIRSNWSLPIHESSLAAVETAVKKACVDRDWKCTKSSNNTYKGKLNVRSHSIAVNIIMEKNEIKYVYIDSENMNYDGAVIHKKYHMWIDRLHSSIKENLK